MTLSDFANDTKQRTVSLRQLSFLLLNVANKLTNLVTNTGD